MSKKNSVPLVWSLCLILMVSTVVLISCQEPSLSNFGSLTISTKAIGSRTISPGSAEIAVVSYSVNGIYSDNATTFPEVTSDSSPITVPALIEGTWSITVNGLNGSGEVVSSKTQNVVIVSGQNTSATFSLVLPVGFGNASITINWPSSVSSFTQIRGSITPVVTGKEGFTVSASSATIVKGVASITGTVEGLPTGSYQFLLEFLDAEDNRVGLTYKESLNIYKDMTSTKTYDVPELVLPVETPVISMDGSFEVSIGCTTENVTIFYTIDTSTPGISSTEYIAPFTITSNKIVKAIALREDRLSSAIAMEQLEVPAATPLFDPGADTYDAPRDITLTTSTTGADIYYTLDGGIPSSASTKYLSPIQVDENTTIQAIAIHTEYANSSVASSTFLIRAAAPTFSHDSNSYLGPQTITLSSTTDEAQIFYSLEGSDPTGGTLYSNPIQIEANTNFKAVSKKDNMVNSAIVERSYVILEMKVATPVFSSEQGTYSENLTVSITSSTPEAAIYYTTGGSIPSASGLRYSGPITIDKTTTFKAIGILPADWVDSDIATATYTIQAVAPTFSLTSGTYQSAQTVQLATTTADATIYYTLDGSDPTTSSLEYSSAVDVDKSMTLNAIAVKDGCTDSGISTISYIIQGTSGLEIADLPNYTVSIQLPEGWETGTVITGAGATITASVTPTPLEGEVSYAWYLDGQVALNNGGNVASITDNLAFGRSVDEISLFSGPHVLTVTVAKYGMTFSDHKVIVAASTGTVGEIDSYEIGEEGPAGGLVFYDKGSYSDEWQYLEAAPTDILIGPLEYGHKFGYYRTTPTGASMLVGTSSNVGTGKANTTALVAAMGSKAYVKYGSDTTTTTEDYAARLCDTLVIGAYDDWFLPSKDELYLMYLNLMANELGDLNGPTYWSSSEFNANDAWGQQNNGGQPNNGKANEGGIRPVRAF